MKMYPEYSRNERAIDSVIHAFGVGGSVIAVPVLLHAVNSMDNALSTLAAVIYSAGLVSMLWLSAIYNLLTHPNWKERIRKYDHAAIFLMIAGTYTPFTLIAIGGLGGLVLLVVVWFVSISGMLLKLRYPRQYERASVLLYLGLGWVGVLAVDHLFAVLSTRGLVMLGIGGLLYSVGVAFHLRDKLPYHNAVWHGLVLTAASCHYVAVLEVLAP